MKILFLQKRPLFPADTGGKIRTLNILRYLARWHDITYLCNIGTDEGSSIDEMRALQLKVESIPWKEVSRQDWRFYVQLAMNVLSSDPFNVAKDFDKRLRRKTAELLAREKFDLVICDFVQMARNIIGLPCSAPKLLFQHNVEAEIFARHATNGHSLALRQYMKLQHAKMRRFESKAGKQFDGVIAVSLRDKQIFEAEYGWKHVRTIDTAVDCDFFRNGNHSFAPDRVVFLGSMDWLPNEDGAEFFVQEIWPRIREERPNAHFQLVGRNPTVRVSQLSRVDGVEVVGTVPDVRPYLSDAHVVVVPLRIGGGTRIKIFEAMAMGKAVVSTSLGAEGLPVTPGKNIAIGDDPSSFAAEVLRLLNDPVSREAMECDARKLVEDDYSAEKVAKQFEKVCCSLVKATGP